jgi:hypothetical protein
MLSIRGFDDPKKTFLKVETCGACIVPHFVDLLRSFAKEMDHHHLLLISLLFFLTKKITKKSSRFEVYIHYNRAFLPNHMYLPRRIMN